MRRHSFCAAAILALAGCSAAHGQTIAPEFSNVYAVVNLGSPPGVPGSLGGINFLDDNTLLIMGAANGGNGALYTLSVIRNAQNEITGFSGTAALYSPASQNDGGLWRMPNGTWAYTTYSNNTIGQIIPGSGVTGRNTALSPLGIQASTGTGTIIPAGFHGAGRLIIGSYSAGRFYILPFSPDGATGFYNFGTVTLPSVFTGGGPEGIVFVPTTSPYFGIQSVLISEYGSGVVAAYEIDSEGLPIPSTRRVFIQGLSGAEGGVLDPVTGQFLFSTFGGGDRIVVVRGFNLGSSNGGCEPADIADDTGEPLPSGRNTGVNEGDYNAFFAGFFDAAPYCDQWDDVSTPLSNPSHGGNNGVNEGDYNGFFQSFFDGCP